MKLGQMENKIGCWLFDAVYLSDTSTSEIVEMVLTRYNAEADTNKKAIFKNSIKNLRDWLSEETLIDELKEVLEIIYENL